MPENDTTAKATPADGAGGDPARTGPGKVERPSVTRGRRILVQVLMWGTTLLAVLAIFAVWANRQMLNPDNWANTSTKLLQNADIREATSNYLVNQLYANVNVEQELKAKLPTQLAPLAGTAVRSAAQPRQRSRPTRPCQPARAGSVEARQPRGRPSLRDDRQRRQGSGRDHRRSSHAQPRRGRQQHHQPPRAAERQPPSCPPRSRS